MATVGEFTITVCLDDGRMYSYDVYGALKAREHSASIVATGYQHNDGKGDFVYYPPHRVAEVRVSGGSIPAYYPDRVGGT